MYSWLNKRVPEDWRDMVAMPYILSIAVGAGGAMVIVAVVMFLAISDIRGPKWFELSLFAIVPLWIMYWFGAGIHVIDYWYDNIDPRRKG